MRPIVAILATTVMLLAAGGPSALTFRATANTDLSTLSTGQVFSLDVLSLNDTNEATSILGATVQFEPGVLRFTGGLASQTFLNDSLFFEIFPRNGSVNVAGTAGAPVDPTVLPNPRALGAESDFVYPVA